MRTVSEDLKDSPGNTGSDSGNDSRNPSIEAVARIERSSQQSRSHVDQLACAITQTAGSGTSILAHAVWFLVWITVNINALPGIKPFDPFPFSFLTMIVSLEAIFLTLFVLVSQNRMSREADKRAQLDLQVNLLAEREATTILRMLQEISVHLGVQSDVTADLEELLKDTDVDELTEKLDEALPSE